MKETEMLPLKEYLNALQEDEVELTFSQVEQILGVRRLNDSAYRYPAWWSNGGQPHSRIWMNAGFKTKKVRIPEQKVTFYRVSASEMYGSSWGRPAGRKEAAPSTSAGNPIFRSPEEKILPVVSVRGYAFRFIASLVPDCENGHIIKNYPQKPYDNGKYLPLNAYGSGAFCHFTIQAGAVPGVYLWISRGEILYIGETVNLQQRFNMGYGNISPRNCYMNGQVTNCKMNKVVMEYFQNGHPIQLYFYETKDHKKVELDLLSQIYTKYNVKDNSNQSSQARRAAIIDGYQNERPDPVDAEESPREEARSYQEQKEKRSVSETFQLIWHLLLDLFRK